VTENASRTAVLEFLHRYGLVSPGVEPVLIPLDGGVSSDLWKVVASGRTLCVKGALAQLKTARVWHAPVSRNRVEHDYLQFAGRACPGRVPEVLAHDPAAGLFAMAYLPPEDHPVWKAQLLNGQVEVAVAAAVGDLVGCLHAASAAEEASAERFATDDNFDALRIEPFFQTTAAVHPDLADRLLELARRTASTHEVVVHGDVSPKNILVGAEGPVLLDAECAWFGDPAFDVAFCVTHLLLKSVLMPGLSAQLLAAAAALTMAYAAHVGWEPWAAGEERIATLLPALALARVDGTSPVEYLDQGRQALVRSVARKMLREPVTTVAEVLEQWSRLAVARQQPR
jgi:tRNA A-37 threonylcarbamoyl transferase component Bud32